MKQPGHGVLDCIECVLLEIWTKTSHSDESLEQNRENNPMQSSQGKSRMMAQHVRMRLKPEIRGNAGALDHARKSRPW